MSGRDQSVVIHRSYEIKLNEKLGKGGFGVVYSAVPSNSEAVLYLDRFLAAFCNPERTKDKKIVVKVLDLAKCKLNERYVLREIGCHQQLHHENVVRLFDYQLIFEGQNGNQSLSKALLVLERMEFGLEEFRDSHKKSREIHALYLLEDTLNALQHIHRCGFIHRDITPGNIMVNYPATGNNPRRPIFKILDLGLSRAPIDEDNPVTSFCGTRTYCAPEQSKSVLSQTIEAIQNQDGRCRPIITGKADIYSIGRVICRYIWNEPDENFRYHRAQSSNRHILFVLLLKAMCATIPECRPSIEECHLCKQYSPKITTSSHTGLVYEAYGRFILCNTSTAFIGTVLKAIRLLQINDNEEFLKCIQYDCKPRPNLKKLRKVVSDIVDLEISSTARDYLLPEKLDISSLAAELWSVLSPSKLLFLPILDFLSGVTFTVIMYPDDAFREYTVGMLQQRLIEQFNLVANDEHRSQLCIVISIVAINGSDEVLLDKNDEINLLLGIPETRIPLQCFEKGMSIRCVLFQNWKQSPTCTVAGDEVESRKYGITMWRLRDRSAACKSLLKLMEDMKNKSDLLCTDDNKQEALRQLKRLYYGMSLPNLEHLYKNEIGKLLIIKEKDERASLSQITTLANYLACDHNLGKLFFLPGQAYGTQLKELASSIAEHLRSFPLFSIFNFFRLYEETLCARSSDSISEASKPHTSISSLPSDFSLIDQFDLPTSGQSSLQSTNFSLISVGNEESFPASTSDILQCSRQQGGNTAGGTIAGRNIESSNQILSAFTPSPTEAEHTEQQLLPDQKVLQSKSAQCESKALIGVPNEGVQQEQVGTSSATTAAARTQHVGHGHQRKQIDTSENVKASSTSSRLPDSYRDSVQRLKNEATLYRNEAILLKRKGDELMRELHQKENNLKAAMNDKRKISRTLDDTLDTLRDVSADRDSLKKEVQKLKDSVKALNALREKPDDMRPVELMAELFSSNRTQAEDYERRIKELQDELDRVRRFFGNWAGGNESRDAGDKTVIGENETIVAEMK
eukprot:gene7269-7666_t